MDDSIPELLRRYASQFKAKPTVVIYPDGSTVLADRGRPARSFGSPAELTAWLKGMTA